MKNFLFVIGMLSFQYCNAQVYEGKIDYNKISQPAIIGEYNYPETTVEKTLRDKLERLGYKVKSSKGYLIISNAVISNISDKQMEYAFKIDRKSKKEKDVTVVTVVMNENNVNTVVTNSSSTKSFLRDLSPAIEAANNENMVKEQYDAVVKFQKKLKNLQDDKASMDKKIRNLEDDIKQNLKEQEDLEKEIARQQEILDAFKAKKSGS